MKTALAALALLSANLWAQSGTGAQSNASPKPPATVKPAARSAAKSNFDKTKFEAYIRHLYIWSDDIKLAIEDPKPSGIDGLQEVRIRATYGNASDERSYLVSRDGNRILDAKVYDINQNPFHEDLDKLHTSGAPSKGTPGAAVVIVMFSDFQCPYCKGEAEMLSENLLKAYPKEVRLYFKDMPLQSIHPWARRGALAGRCAFAQSEDAFWKYHDWTYSHQEEIDEGNFATKMDEFAKTGAVDKAKFDACREAPETAKALDAAIDEAHALGINSTPTLYVNGRKIASAIRWENLVDVIDFEIGYQKKEHNAGEACCTLALPNPLGAPAK